MGKTIKLFWLKAMAEYQEYFLEKVKLIASAVFTGKKHLYLKKNCRICSNDKVNAVFENKLARKYRFLIGYRL